MIYALNGDDGGGGVLIFLLNDGGVSLIYALNGDDAAFLEELVEVGAVVGV